jgi:hypothetical protein
MQDNAAPPQCPGYLNVFPGNSSLGAPLPPVVQDCIQISESYDLQPILIDECFLWFNPSKFGRAVRVWELCFFTTPSLTLIMSDY